MRTKTGMAEAFKVYQAADAGHRPKNTETPRWAGFVGGIREDSHEARLWATFVTRRTVRHPADLPQTLDDAAPSATLTLMHGLSGAAATAVLGLLA